MPAIELYSYQQRWLKDQQRFKIGMFARQTGKTFTTTLEIADDCLDAESQGRRERWVILSRGERQAREAMEEGIKRHLNAYQVGFESLSYDWEGSYKALEVTLPNGSRITALPANPDTARGFSANVFLDEFAFHADSRKIWQALFPVISKPGLKLRITSTPNGKGNKFYELMTGTDEQWSRHQVDIYQAVADGLPRDVEQLREAINDPDAWATEFELQWLDEASAWLPYDLIAPCEVADLIFSDDRWVRAHTGAKAYYLGWDIARRRDLSILWLIDDQFKTAEIVRMRGRNFEFQQKQFRFLMDAYPVRRACLDQTGMGEVLVELAQREYGTSRIEGVLFSGTTKQDLATVLKQRYEDRQVTVPIHRDVRDSLHAVKRLTTSAGNIRFDAERTDAGHGDYFWAQALAVHAATNPHQPIEYASLGTPRLGYQLDGFTL
jgi:phage FluMu gp28-like protein